MKCVDHMRARSLPMHDENCPIDCHRNFVVDQHMMRCLRTMLLFWPLAKNDECLLPNSPRHAGFMQCDRGTPLPQLGEAAPHIDIADNHQKPLILIGSMRFPLSVRSCYCYPFVTMASASTRYATYEDGVITVRLVRKRVPLSLCPLGRRTAGNSRPNKNEDV